MGPIPSLFLNITVFEWCFNQNFVHKVTNMTSTTALSLMMIYIMSNTASNSDHSSTCTSSISSVKQLLIDEGLSKIYDKLYGMQLIENDLILYLNEDELEDISNKLDITIMEKYRFKAMIRKLKHEKQIDTKPSNLQRNDEIKIELMVDSHRDHLKGGENGDPKYLLQENDNRYYSGIYYGFKRDEDDWIIFKFINKNKLYLPKRLYIRNWDSSDDKGVKIMSVSIGDKESDEWITFNPYHITLHNLNKEPQMITIDGIDAEIIKKKRYRYIRLLLKENHGGWLWISPKYVLIGIDVYGIEI